MRQVRLARSAAVVMGPALALQSFGLASLAATVAWWGKRPRSKGERRLKQVAAAGATTPFLYYALARPWHMGWGATEDETRHRLPGDEIYPRAITQSTRAVNIDAAPEEVWRWLVQIGVDKAGFYSYDILEDLAGLGLHSADRIVPEWQALKLGDLIRSAPEEMVHEGGWRVVECRAPDLLFLKAPGFSWCFYLHRRDGATRLIVRSRSQYSRGLGTVAGYLFGWEIQHFLMERKMLLGIKTRAERTATSLDEFVPEAPFRDSISVRVKASPAEIFRALEQVTPAEMPIATFLGSVRYLPGRLTGRLPPGQKQAADEPFLKSLGAISAELKREPGREIVTGGAGKYHQFLSQEPARLAGPEDFDAFRDPDYEKLVISIRIGKGNEEDGYLLTLEHRTQPLSEASEQKFRRYWRVIKPSGAFVTRQLLIAVKRRAEQYATERKDRPLLTAV